MRVHKQFVLLSGGLDSATLLYKTKKDEPPSFVFGDAIEPVEAVSINYGQRHGKEMDHAGWLSRALSLNHVILQMPDLLAGSMLTDRGAAIPDVSYADLPEGVSPTYVPFRNGLMLSMLAAHAQKWVNLGKPPEGTPHRLSGPPPSRHATIYIGAHAEDAERNAYPDCSPGFLIPMAEAIDIGTYATVSLEFPFMNLTKAEVIMIGTELGVPYERTWSCYRGEEFHCGKCPTCRARKEAFATAGEVDPTTYAA